MDLLQNLLFSFLGGLFEAIDIVTKQSSINTCLQCKLSNIGIYKTVRTPIFRTSMLNLVRSVFQTISKRLTNFFKLPNKIQL